MTDQAQPLAKELSYETLVDLLMSNKPVPGIREIPDTVLGVQSSSKPTVAHRKKPWEADTSTDLAKEPN